MKIDSTFALLFVTIQIIIMITVESSSLTVLLISTTKETTDQTYRNKEFILIGCSCLLWIFKCTTDCYLGIRALRLLLIIVNIIASSPES